MTPQFINVKNYDVDNGDVSKGDVTKCDVNSSDVFRVQKVMRNNCDVAYSNAPTTGLNSLKSTNEKASNMSRDGVDQSKEGSDRSKMYCTFSTDYVGLSTHILCNTNSNCTHYSHVKYTCSKYNIALKNMLETVLY